MGMNELDLDLFDAAEFGDLDWVQQSINGVSLSGESVNIDAQDNKGETILMVASRYNHVEIVRFLLERGANPNLKDNQGQTALIKAKVRGHSDTIKLLMQYGALS